MTACSVAGCRAPYLAEHGKIRLCLEHMRAWDSSGERKRADSALGDFVRRVGAEGMHAGPVAHVSNGRNGVPG